MASRPPNPAGLPPTPIPGAPGSPGAAFLALAVSLLIVGAVAEGLYRVAPGASYGFVLIVILGYFAVGGRLANVVQFFNSLGIIKGGTA